jgi:parvulin-like peptidyl-prolyl isomerase
VVDSLITQNGNIDSFYQANQRNYLVRAAVEASLIRTATRKQADAALKALKGGMKFSDAAAKFSNHASKANEGRLSRLQRGDFQPDLASPELIDSLFFNEKTRFRPGAHSGVIVHDGGNFLIIRVDSHSPERIPSITEVRERVIGDFVRQRKAPKGEAEIAALKTKHEVRLVSRDKIPTEKELRAYYDAHKDQYETPESFELYHIEGSDEAKLAAAIANVGDLEAFKALAGRVSENAMTRAQQGYVGVVKRDFTLPYGIGMMPGLFPLLDEETGGKIGEVVENPTTLKWHAFWLVKKAAPAAKPFDRVRASVAEDVRANVQNIAHPMSELYGFRSTKTTSGNRWRSNTQTTGDEWRSRIVRHRVFIHCNIGSA